MDAPTCWAACAADLARVLNDTLTRLQAGFARQAQFTADASYEPCSGAVSGCALLAGAIPEESQSVLPTEKACPTNLPMP